MTDAHHSDEIVLVVGGTSGIGLAAARQLAAQGATVHIAGRSADRLTALAVSDPALTGHRLDGSDATGVAELAADIGPIDALVVTLAGSEGVGGLADLDVQALRRAFEAKFWPTLTVLQATLSHLADTASITLVGAITAHAAMPATAGIGALNAAVEALVRPLAAELAPRRVNAVSPGFVDTPWWGAMPEQDRADYFATTAQALPVRHISTPEEIAEVIVLLAQNGTVTGSVFETDGGARLVTL